jgi:hypothetical protein
LVRILYDMTIIIFTIISALAAVAYTIVAFRTLLEIKAQRETTYRPDIIVDEGLFYIYSYKTEKGEFPVEYTYEKKGQLYHCDNFRMGSFSLNLFNIGLAAAKEIQIEYSFDLDKITSIINEQNKTLPADKIISIRKEKAFLEFKAAENAVGGGSFHVINNQLKREINHILPVNVSSNPIKIALPTYILEMHSILIYNFWMNDAKEKEFPDLPIINLKMNYLDIGNNKHSKEYELSILYHGGTKNESMNAFKVKQKNCA